MDVLQARDDGTGHSNSHAVRALCWGNVLGRLCGDVIEMPVSEGVCGAGDGDCGVVETGHCGDMGGEGAGQLLWAGGF
jgi:hypothetical protein